MAGTLLLLLDDIATVLDDVALLTKVGGGILAHGWHDVGQGIEDLSRMAGSLLQAGLGLLLNMLLGVLVGGAALLVVTLAQRLRRKLSTTKASRGGEARR